MPKPHKEKAFQIKSVNLCFACHSIWLYLLVRCKGKSKHFRATSIGSENRQFLISPVYAGDPVLLTFLRYELNCGFSGGMRAWIPGAKYKKETVQCLRRFQPASGPPGWAVTFCSSKRGVSWHWAEPELAWAGFQLTLVAAVVFRVSIFFNYWTTFLLCAYRCRVLCLLRRCCSSNLVLVFYNKRRIFLYNIQWTHSLFHTPYLTTHLVGAIGDWGPPRTTIAYCPNLH